MIDHDVPPGPLHHCQICGSHDLRQLIDLGHQPLCDALLTAEQLNEPETYYPLRLNQCQQCSLAQLDYVVPADKVYPADYPYRAGISWPVVEAHKQMAASLVGRFGKGLVVDIGSNDGTLLKQFMAHGCKIVGWEPTGIAKIAEAEGIPTAEAFFGEDAADCFDGMTAHIVTMTNVFAHMADLGNVMRGIAKILNDDGVVVIENHYLLDILEGNQFDSIYHEHIRTYTLKSLVTLFEQYGMEVFDAERVPRYGGNIRIFVGWRASNWPVKPSIRQLLAHEEAAGVCDQGRWSQFRRDIYNERYQFEQFMVNDDDHVAGCSAPGRASTLLNYYGNAAKAIRYTGELDGSLKIGKFLPGCHIPVVSNRRLIEEQPDAIILLAWHYADEIADRLRREGVKSRLFVPLPFFREVT